MRKLNIINIENTIVNYNAKVWIVGEDNPLKPIIKIPYREFLVIKGGHYKKTNKPLNVSNKKLYFPEYLYQRLKNKTDIIFSFREWLNPDLSDEKPSFDTKWLIDRFKKKDDAIYFVTDKAYDSKFTPMYNQLIDELKLQGVTVEKMFHLSKLTINQSHDEKTLKLIRILMESVLGKDIQKYNITNKEVDKFNYINYIDSNKPTLYRMNNIITHFITLIETENKINLSKRLKEVQLYFKLFTSNTLNPFEKYDIELNRSMYVENFKSFKESIYLGKIDLKDYRLKVDPYAHSAYFDITDKQGNNYEFEMKPDGEYDIKKDMHVQKFEGFRIFFPHSRNISTDKFEKLVEKLIYIINKNRLGYKVKISNMELEPKYGLLPYCNISINKEIDILEFERLVASTKALNPLVDKDKGFDNIYF